MLLAGILLCPAWTRNGCADAGQVAEPTVAQGGEVEDADSGADVYHTPLAGEPFHNVFLGRAFEISARDRRQLTSLTLGGAYYTQKQGDTPFTPVFALYLRHNWEKSRTRDVISVFVNDLEYDRGINGSLELVCRFENETIPGGQKETLNNREVNETSVESGALAASIGPGLRYMVSPYEVDNDLRLQLLGRVGYFYASQTDETGAGQILPPDTMFYGAKLRARYDGMRRNILELPHTGLAAGFDLDYTHRDKWADSGKLGGGIFTRANTQDYVQLSGYITGVTGIPGMSEKDRFLFSIHGGTTPENGADRFNAFRIGGGPIPGESDDLARLGYSGTMFSKVLAKDYFLASLEYRRALTFFMYLHLRGSYIWADRTTVVNTDEVTFRKKNGTSWMVGLDTAFIWDSSVYLAFSHDTGFIRDGRPGNGVILTWNILF